MKDISIIDAHYIEGYKVELVFNDMKKVVIDFGKFLNKYKHPQYDKYKQLRYFKKFKIEMGNIVWGKDWDLIFPVWDLYHGKIGTA